VLPPPPRLPCRRQGNASWNLPTPAPGDAGFGTICAQYDASRCCSDDYTALYGSGPVGAANPAAIYPDFTYNQCPENRTMSAACVAFLALQECSFSCDPMLAVAYSTGQTIPLCANFCDAWFDACAADYTCDLNWNSWGEITVNGSLGYFCPVGSTCRTFAEVYGNASGLCTNMWGPTDGFSATYSYAANTTNW
jgi:hypothetical protein